TPLVQNGILEGITRNTVFELLNDTNIKFCETSLSSYDLYNADECFLTGSAVEIIPVIMIDGRVIGDGTLGFYTKKLIKNFKLKTAG
ncbi:MAG: aminotransferase class IV, partial [Spirochaetes bacterium]|nr:aminotransferase class IV [Spirochaetota bacterium]